MKDNLSLVKTALQCAKDQGACQSALPALDMLEANSLPLELVPKGYNVGAFYDCIDNVWGVDLRPEDEDLEVIIASGKTLREATLSAIETASKPPKLRHA